MTIRTIIDRKRTTMGKRDDMYKLSKMVEPDEGYFENPVSEYTKKHLKPGRVCQLQTNVAVIGESIAFEDFKTGESASYCRFFKMKVLKTQNSGANKEVVQKSLDSKTIIFSDKSTSFLDIEKCIEAYATEKSIRETNTETIHWLHIAISHTKRSFLEFYHKIKIIPLQNYLNNLFMRLICSALDIS